MGEICEEDGRGYRAELGMAPVASNADGSDLADGALDWTVENVLCCVVAWHVPSTPNLPVARGRHRDGRLGPEATNEHDVPQFREQPNADGCKKKSNETVGTAKPKGV